MRLEKMSKSELALVTGEPVTMTAWMPSDVPELPYIVIVDDQTTDDSSDDTVDLIEHSYSLERYSETQDTNERLEKYLRTHGCHYSKSETWLDDPDDMWMTVYIFTTIERLPR